MKHASRKATIIVTLASLAVLMIGGRGVAHAQALTTLYSFCQDPMCSDGAHPAYETLVQGLDGSFYGTTPIGGTTTCGTVFKIAPTGELTSLSLPFDPNRRGCWAGAGPFAGLVLSTSGIFYGTTAGGGANGKGTVFSFSSDSSFAALYSFSGQDDGGLPESALVQGNDGNLYGITRFGGLPESCSGNGCGTIFQITPDGVLTTLHQFASTDGVNENTHGALVQGSDGKFYGTTEAGGQYGYGTVFTITPDGQFTTLYSFANGPNDGASPYAGLVQGRDGNFYGTTPSGGPAGKGTVFKIAPDGVLTILYKFGTNFDDGDTAVAPLMLAADGTFYGTTAGAGVNRGGTVFQYDPTSGILTTLISFRGIDGSEGSRPLGGLVQDVNGVFYGTTQNGGTPDRHDDGTVFSLAPGTGSAGPRR